jgi:hypothetical protein
LAPGLEALGRLPIFGSKALDVRAFRVIREAIWLAADLHRFDPCLEQ